MSIKRATVYRVIVSACLVAMVAVLGLWITYRIAERSRDDYFEQREVQASTAAAAIDCEEVMSLKGDSSDVETPAFQRIRAQLVRIKHSDIRIRFVYLMRPQGGKMIFLVDAEDPTSPDYSPPGQVYDEAKPQDFYVFEGKRRPDTVIEGPIVDRWGTWISASAYIMDKRGTPVALLGTDADIERALAAFNEIKRLGTTFDLLAVALLALVALQWIVWRYNRDRRESLRVEVENRALELNRELMKADRMKSDFIQLASHELRSPVNAVNVAVQTIDRSLRDKLNPEEQALVDVAKNGSGRLIDLVDNLLDLNRIEAGDLVLKPKEVDLGDLVGRTVKLFEPLAMERDLNLTAQIPDGDLSAFLDPQAFLRVLENLVGNAIKFTDSGEITIGFEVGDDTVRFAVKDTGRGVPEDFQGELFKKFSKLHVSGESCVRGAGMGLALCRGLVEAQGGRIWYEGEEGKGSTFHFEIPRRRKG